MYARAARCCCQVNYGKCLKENYYLHVTPEELIARMESILAKEKKTTTTTPFPTISLPTTTQTPEVKKALGFEVSMNVSYKLKTIS